MKKIASAVCILCLALTGCASGSTEAGAGEKPKEILVGISPDFPPYETVNTKGELEGFDVDMANWIFDYMNSHGQNYSCEFVKLPFDTIVSALQAGQVDLGISGFTYDKNRQGLFSDSYYTSAQVIIVPKDSAVTGSKNLHGKLVGAQQGNTSEQAAASIPGAKVQTVTDVKSMMETLKAGGVDAVVLDLAVAKNYEDSGDFKVLDERLMDEKNIIYSSENNQELMNQVNQAIQAFTASEDYKTLVQKWFGA
ncbi:MAG: transporter substrate-binding domain-containing protein [Erysipelotrichaceae bacterium]|mgnify:CR=1 FL=1|nr:transporter substrate-binding domain-containing protein [Erysipelotrichaceae bacterium]